MHPHALLRWLKAAPGLEVETPQGRGVSGLVLDSGSEICLSCAQE